MAAKSRATKRSSRKAARRPSRPKAKLKARGRKTARAKARPKAKPRGTSRPKAARRRAAAGRKGSVRKPASAKRVMKRARPSEKARRKTPPQPARRPAARPAARQTTPPAAKRRKAPARERLPFAAAAGRPAQRPALDRNRRVLPSEERLDAGEMNQPSEDTERMLSAVRTGREEIREQLELNTAASPRLTAGDVDAKWQDAYAVGDEAPGGDNMTPDQDIVDDIGRALGVEYEDDEELKGAEKLEERDRNRWELDPASSEDWPHEK